MTKVRGKTISVFGSSRVGEGSQDYKEARLLGRLLAEAGFTVMNGGYAGTMEAVSRGAREGGGRVIGVTLQLFAHLSANRWLDEEMKMPTYLARLKQLTIAPDGCIALKGGVGTLTELSVTWSLLQIRAVPRKPFILLGQHWHQIMDVLSRETFIRPQDFALLRVVDTAEKAVETLSGFFGA
ncbi:MAG TPA: LOG family protein [Anaerolineae bacterium]|nr:LOG family protein [Anaerolineae bacterium]